MQHVLEQDSRVNNRFFASSQHISCRRLQPDSRRLGHLSIPEPHLLPTSICFLRGFIMCILNPTAGRHCWANGCWQVQHPGGPLPPDGAERWPDPSGRCRHFEAAAARPAVPPLGHPPEPLPFRGNRKVRLVGFNRLQVETEATLHAVPKLIRG